jgi:hypothetical protein
MRRAYLLVGLLSAGGCSQGPSSASDGGGGTDAGLPTDAGFDAGSWTPGPHQPYPAVPWHGGPTLQQPKLVTLTYATDPNAGLRGPFGDFLFTSEWFAAWRGDYSVGPGAQLATVQLDGGPAPDLDETSAGAVVVNAIASGAAPPPDAGDVFYMLYLPAGPSLTFGGNPVCEEVNGADFYGGYHWEAQYGAGSIPFAVIPTCKSGNVTESESHIEFSGSHEFAEACTDPFPSSNVAYEIQDSSVWATLGGEVGDICNGLFGLEKGYSLQRVWSNSSAAQGNDPCLLPQVAEPYYAASLSPSATQMVAAGQSITLTVQGWSMAAVTDWTLSLNSTSMGFEPSLQLGSTTLNDSQTTTLVVTVPSTATSGSQALIFLLSERSTTDYSFWPELIQVL